MTESDQHTAASASAPAALPGGGRLFGPQAWPRIVPFAAYMLFIGIADVLARLGVPADALRWLYPVKVGVVALLLALFWRRYDELAHPRLPSWSPLVAVATGIVVLVLWIGLNADWMSVGTSAGFDPRVDGRIDMLLVVIRIAGAALVVPVMEELFWRSFLLRWVDDPDFQSIDPSQSSTKSFVITALLFGFEHNLWLAGIVAGAAYSLLYKRYRNLWSPILAHAVTNGLLGVWVVHTGTWSYW